MLLNICQGNRYNQIHYLTSRSCEPQFFLDMKKWLMQITICFHLKLVIYLEYMKFQRILLPNCKKINVEHITKEVKYY